MMAANSRTILRLSRRHQRNFEKWHGPTHWLRMLNRKQTNSKEAAS